MISSLDSHLDGPEHILMAVFYRFICNLHKAIRDWKNYSSDLGKSLLGEAWEDQFEVKLRSDMSSWLSEYISEQPVLKGLSWSLYFENCKDSFFYGCIKNLCFAFSKKNLKQTEVENDSISKECS